MKRGAFILIEGGDGAGKDTQIALLQKDFPEGDQFVYTRDPGGTELGVKLREITQYGENVARETELLVLLASRAQLVHEVILPAIEQGKHVFCNRFDLSTIAYQIYGRQRLEMADTIKTMSEFARDGARADLAIVLDIDPELAHQRLVSRGTTLTRFEKEKLDFHERVRQGYLEAAKTYPNTVVLDGARSPEEVYVDVVREVKRVLAQ